MEILLTGDFNTIFPDDAWDNIVLDTFERAYPKVNDFWFIENSWVDRWLYKIIPTRHKTFVTFQKDKPSRISPFTLYMPRKDFRRYVKHAIVIGNMLNVNYLPRKIFHVTLEGAKWVENKSYKQ